VIFLHQENLTRREKPGEVGKKGIGGLTKEKGCRKPLIQRGEEWEKARIEGRRPPHEGCKLMCREIDGRWEKIRKTAE